MRLKRLYCLLALICFSLCLMQAKTYTPNENGRIYVNQSATGSGDGSSWEDAATSLADVLAYASKYWDRVSDIWIAKGTYIPKYGGNYLDVSEGNQTFAIPGGLNIYGGFAGTETLLEERNWVQNQTIFNGLIGEKSVSKLVTIQQNNILIDGCVFENVGTSSDILVVSGSNIIIKNSKLLGDPNSTGIYTTTGISLNSKSNLEVYNTLIAECRYGVNTPYTSSEEDKVSLKLLNVTIANAGFNAIRLNRGYHTLDLENTILFKKEDYSDYSKSFANVGQSLYMNSNLPAIITYKNTYIQGFDLESSTIKIPYSAKGSGNIATISGTGGINGQDWYKRPYFDEEYRLQAYSPLINKGNNDLIPSGMNKDLGGSSRIFGSSVDLGAFETQSTTNELLHKIERTSGSIEQNVQNNSAITPIVFQLSGGATNVSIEGLPPGMSYVVDSEKKLTISGSSTIAGLNTIKIKTIGSSASPEERVINITISPNITGSIIYVNQVKTGDGSSWENAMNDLSEALKYAYNNPSIQEIWVAKGTYFPRYSTSFATPTTLSYRTFAMRSDLKLYGGFSGDEATKDLRNWENNPTILSGKYPNDLTQFVLSIIGNNATVDGFTIENNKGQGAIQFTRNSDVSIINSAELNNLKMFHFNKSTDTHGSSGVRLEYRTSGIMKNCLITGFNSGGVMFNYTPESNTTDFAKLDMYNVTLTDNYGKNNSQTIFLYSGNHELYMEDCIIFQKDDPNCYTLNNETKHISIGVSCNSTHNPKIRYKNVYLQGEDLENYPKDIYYVTKHGCADKSLDIDGINGWNGVDLNNRPFLDENGQLQQWSPFVDKGSYTTAPTDRPYDLAANPRVYASKSDLGAFELQESSITPHKIDWVSGSTMQNVSASESIEDIIYKISGGATNVSIEGLPLGISYQLNQDKITIEGLTNIPGRYKIKISTIGNIAPSQERTIEINVAPKPDTNGIVYVDKTKNGDGSSWENAMKELSEALVWTDINSNISQIWVAKGTYYPDRLSEYNLFYNSFNEDNDISLLNDERTRVFFVKDIKLYGGFDPANNIINLTDKRDSSLTILSGDIGIENDYTDNTHHVVIAISNKKETTVDGFTITKGNATGNKNLDIYNDDILVSIPQWYGAGIIALANKNKLSITNNRIKDNIAGTITSKGKSGGIALDYNLTQDKALIVIENNIIENNSALGGSASGGGIGLNEIITYDSPKRRLENEKLNSLQKLSSPESGVIIQHNKISNNLVEGTNAAGGGIGAQFYFQVYFQSTKCNLSINYNEISSNIVNGINSRGGGISFELENNTYIEQSFELDLSYNLINDNKAQSDRYLHGGGGLFLATTDSEFCSGTMSIANNVIVKNESQSDGGGIVLSISTTNSNYETHFINNTISDNIANGKGGGIAEIDKAISQITIANNIIWRNIGETGSEDIFLLSDQSLKHCLFGESKISQTTNGIAGNIENIELPELPLPIVFIEQGNDKSYYNLSIDPRSVAIDKGDNQSYALVGNLYSDLDFLNYSRLYGDKIDIGAYEFFVLCPTSITPDENGIVYVKDYTHGNAPEQDPDGATGDSWATAHPSLADVLSAARDYPYCFNEIRVSEGIFHPKYDLTTNIPVTQYTHKEASFVIPDHIIIRGGYPVDAITSEYANKYRSTREHETILDGTCNGERVYHVMLIPGIDPKGSGENPYIEGMTIRNGFAEVIGDSKEYSWINNAKGGTISYIPENGYVKMIHNDKGAGIYIDHSNPTLKNVVITSNESENNGAGLYVGPCFDYTDPKLPSNVKLINVIIDHNASQKSGGGICNGDPTNVYISLHNVTVANNYADESGGGIYGQVTMYNSIVWNNTDTSSDNISGNIYAGENNTVNNSLIEGADLDGLGGSGSWNTAYGSNSDNSFYDFEPWFMNNTTTNSNDQYDYSLQGKSKAIDKGDDTYYTTNVGIAPDKDVDAYSQLRKHGTSNDLGAVETLLVELSIRIFLQGPTISDGQSGAKMTNYIQTAPNPPASYFIYGSPLPIENPYNIRDKEGELVASNDIRDVNKVGEVVDWIQVEIWSANTTTMKYTPLETRALLLLSNGNIVDIDGSIPQFFSHKESVYITVKHRNHLGVMSQAISLLKGSYTYDFTTGLDKVLELIPGQKVQMIEQVSGSGVYCLWAGDFTKNGFVNYEDVDIFQNSFKVGEIGKYVFADINMDGRVNYVDEYFFNPIYIDGKYTTLRFFTPN